MSLGKGRRRREVGEELELRGLRKDGEKSVFEESELRRRKERKR